MRINYTKYISDSESDNSGAILDKYEASSTDMNMMPLSFTLDLSGKHFGSIFKFGEDTGTLMPYIKTPLVDLGLLVSYSSSDVDITAYVDGTKYISDNKLVNYRVGFFARKKWDFNKIVVDSSLSFGFHHLSTTNNANNDETTISGVDGTGSLALYYRVTKKITLGPSLEASLVIADYKHKENGNSFDKDGTITNILFVPMMVRVEF